MSVKAHLDFADGTSAWVDLTDLLPPLPRWTYDVREGGKGVLIDREGAFPPIVLSGFRNEDVARVPEIRDAMERLYPRPEGRRYGR